MAKINGISVPSSSVILCRFTLYRVPGYQDVWNKPGHLPKSSDSQPSSQFTVSWTCPPSFFLLPWILPVLSFHIRIQSWVGPGTLGFTGISGMLVMGQALPFFYYCLHWTSIPQLPSQGPQ